ncbi:MAG: PIN domain-containing protein [Actinobacteria bacterium]|nr:PIN domain-containing protein [Actinomycetota bacterium]
MKLRRAADGLGAPGRLGDPSFDVVEIDAEPAERAAGLTVTHALRSLDALHLAAALLLPAPVTVATWDVRLRRAARAAGLATLPQEP